jgi:hypothetical protein
MLTDAEFEVLLAITAILTALVEREDEIELTSPSGVTVSLGGDEAAEMLLERMGRVFRERGLS